MNVQSSMRSIVSVAGRVGTASLLFLTAGFSVGVAAPLQLHVSGAAIKDSNNTTVWLRGVNIPSLEWSNTGDNISISPGVALGSNWKCNIIRLPICQDRWLGHDSAQTDGGAAYRGLVDSVVNTASNAGAYVIVDMHWSDMGTWGQNFAQHRMADNNTTSAWIDIANHYKNNPAVLFGLYNEPHDISWSVWRNGGSITENYNGTNYTYNSPGLQGLLTAIRNQGAKNVALAGMNVWATDDSGITSGYALTESGGGNGIVYDVHIYPQYNGFDGYTKIENSGYMVFIGECGSAPNYWNGNAQQSTDWCNQIFPWIDQHHHNFTAWDLHPASGPQIIADWNYTPTTWYGVILQQHLLADAGGGGIPPVPSGLTASAGNAQITLSWSASSGATSYKVYRGTTPGGEASGSIANPASTSYTNSGLANGTTYYYKVTALNTSGESGKSGEASATPSSGGGSTLFSTGFEAGNTQPTWNDSPDGAYNGSPLNVGPYSGGIPECSTRSEGNTHGGSVALMYSGTDNSATTSFCYYRVFSVSIPITSATKMSYWIFPQQDNGRYVGIDYHCTDGTTLRDSGATDYNGKSMHPNAGHGGAIALNAYTQIKCNVGQWLSGKTIDKIWVSYDRGPNTGQFRGYIDDILITNGTLP